MEYSKRGPSGPFFLALNFGYKYSGARYVSNKEETEMLRRVKKALKCMGFATFLACVKLIAPVIIMTIASVGAI